MERNLVKPVLNRLAYTIHVSKTSHILRCRVVSIQDPGRWSQYWGCVVTGVKTVIIRQDGFQRGNVQGFIKIFYFIVFRTGADASPTVVIEILKVWKTVQLE